MEATVGSQETAIGGISDRSASHSSSLNNGRRIAKKTGEGDEKIGTQYVFISTNQRSDELKKTQERAIKPASHHNQILASTDPKQGAQEAQEEMQVAEGSLQSVFHTANNMEALEKESGIESDIASGLIVAAEKGNITLPQATADPNQQDKDGNTLLHYFSSRHSEEGLSETINLLLKQGADANIKDKNGRTPLHAAVFSDCDVAIEALLKNDRNIVFVQDNHGNTAYDCATQMVMRSDIKLGELENDQCQLSRWQQNEFDFRNEILRMSHKHVFFSESLTFVLETGLTHVLNDSQQHL